MKTRLLVPAVLATATIGLVGIPATAAHAESGSPTPSTTETATTPAPGGTLSVSTTSLTESESASEGVTFTGSGLEPNTQYTLAIGQENSGDSLPVTTDGEGSFTQVLGGAGDPLSVGTYSAGLYTTGEGPQQVGDTVSFEVTADEETEEPTESASPSSTPSETPSETEAPEVARALLIEPEEVDVDDFVNEEEGVAIIVTGLEPGETATLAVDPESDSVTEFEMTQVANEEGTAAFSVYGTNSSTPEVYLGTYDVVVSSDSGEDLTGSFEVVDGTGNGGGNDDDDEAGNGGELPRTGTELTGLAVGASLLILGAGTVLVTRRRIKGTGISDA